MSRVGVDQLQGGGGREDGKGRAKGGRGARHGQAVSGRGLGLKDLATGNSVKSSHTEFSHNWEEF